MINGPWKIEMFGDLRARQGGRVHTRFRTQKTGSLLAYLAYFLQRAHPREELIEMLWPDAELEQGRPTLSVALSSLRHQLEPPGAPAGSVIVANHSTVCLNPDFITTDVSQFQSLVRSAEAAETTDIKKQCLLDAIALVRGELLPGRYEDWCAIERERLSELYVEALRSMAALLVEARDFTGALTYARQAVQVNPLREELHRDVMRLCASTGQPAAAIQQFRSLESLLQVQLNAMPAPATQQLVKEIEQRLTRAVSVELKSSHATTSIAAPSSSVAVSHAIPARVCTILLLQFSQEESQTRADASAIRARMRRQSLQYGGVELRTTADFTAVFAGTSDALSAAAATHRLLWGAGTPEREAGTKDFRPAILLKAALHSGEIASKFQSEAPVDLNSNPVIRHGLKLLRATPVGQILASAETASLLRRNLEPGFSLRSHGLYRLHDEDMAEELFEVRCAGISRAETLPPKAEPAAGGSLPLALTRFFGQGELLDRLEQWLNSAPSADEEAVAARLLTVTGPGGAGKTRLALEAARRRLPALHGAVWFVPLADIQDSELFADAVRSGLRLSAAPGVEPMEQIVEALSRQPSLLVLDNLEQLVENAASKVRELIERIPSLRCLVTSRRRLDLSGERECPIPPLTVPKRDDPPERLMLCESVQLFVDRAQSVKPDFQVTPKNAPFVADLCARLEGIPLAVELAAARAQSLTPAQMVARLDRPLDLLSGSKRDRPPRHQTLRAAFDWSYDMLAPELRDFFAQLSVFPHSWDLDAAEEILEAPLALDWLAQLRECSLLSSDEDVQLGGMRYSMLETVRAYARERLGDENRESLRGRHADYYLARAQLAASELGGQSQDSAAALLRAEYDNLRAAISCYLARHEADSAAQIALALVKSLERRGLLDSARVLLRNCLDQQNVLSDSNVRARLLVSAGWFAFLQSDYDEAADKTRAGLNVSRGACDKNGESIALNNLALVTQALGDLSEARRLFEASLELARELGDMGRQAARLSNLGLLAARENRYADARRYLEQAHRIYRQSDDQYGASASLCNLGDLALRMEDWAEAASVSAEALKLFRTLQDRPGIAYALTNFAESSLQRKDRATMKEALVEGLEIATALRLQGLVPILIEIWARAQLSVNRTEQSAFALGAADSLRSLTPEQSSADDRARLSPVRDSLATILSSEQKSRIAARIAGLSRDDLVQSVLSDIKEPANAE